MYKLFPTTDKTAAFDKTEASLRAATLPDDLQAWQAAMQQRQADNSGCLERLESLVHNINTVSNESVDAVSDIFS